MYLFSGRNFYDYNVAVFSYKYLENNIQAEKSISSLYSFHYYPINCPIFVAVKEKDCRCKAKAIE